MKLYTLAILILAPLNLLAAYKGFIPPLALATWYTIGLLTLYAITQHSQNKTEE